MSILLILIGGFVDKNLILIIEKNKMVLKENISGTHIMGAIWGIQKYPDGLFNYDKIKLWRLTNFWIKNVWFVIDGLRDHSFHFSHLIYI